MAALAVSLLFARNRHTEALPGAAEDGVNGAAISLSELRRAGF